MGKQKGSFYSLFWKSCRVIAVTGEVEGRDGSSWRQEALDRKRTKSLSPRDWARDQEFPSGRKRSRNCAGGHLGQRKAKKAARQPDKNSTFWNKEWIMNPPHCQSWRRGSPGFEVTSAFPVVTQHMLRVWEKVMRSRMVSYRNDSSKTF